MPTITIYGGRSGSSFRPHWMLAELGLPYETKTLDFAAGENRSPEYLAINPAGQIPTMIYDGRVLTESAAIVHYLAEKHDPKFFGPYSIEAHAESLRWQLFILLNVDKNFVTLCMKKWGRPASEEAETAAKQALDRYLPIFEAQLAGKDYVLGADFTVADIVTRSTFNYAELAEVDLSPYPAVMAWMKRCEERPAYAKAKQG
ncbi:MAG TPA: glutathione S-transferase family protein [Patescibacteria group bacterium]|nr:glutathione S-transferase family protein [Patescibacteria group bacterium]